MKPVKPANWDESQQYKLWFEAKLFEKAVLKGFNEGHSHGTLQMTIKIKRWSNYKTSLFEDIDCTILKHFKCITK